MASMDNHPVLDVLRDMAETVESKAHDYADDENVYSNFEGAARLAGVSVDTVFHVMIGIKMERLRQLMSGKEPNHESIDDTLIDAANYLALWEGYRRQDQDMPFIEPMQLTLQLDRQDRILYNEEMPIYGVPI